MGRRPSEQQEYLNSYLAIKDPKKLEEAYRKLLAFKDFKGCKKVQDIHQYYEFFKILGKGSFGKAFLVECGTDQVLKFSNIIVTFYRA
jgi:hypothetical protein